MDSILISFAAFDYRSGFDYRSLPIRRPAMKRTNSEPLTTILQIERYCREQNRPIHANRSHGDLNTVEPKWSHVPPHSAVPHIGTSGDSCSNSSSTSSPPSSPHPAAVNGTSLSAQEELDQFPDSHFSFTGEVIMNMVACSRLRDSWVRWIAKAQTRKLHG